MTNNGQTTQRHPRPSDHPLKVARPIVLVGLMGAGKTTVGRRLADRLGLDFVDSDDEVERAADRSITEIFDAFGETAFRDGERRVIARLLDGGARVIATGGGAFIDEQTRAIIRHSAVSVWLKADLDVLVERTGRRDTRPLLRGGDRADILSRLMAERYPIYAEADITIDTLTAPHDHAVTMIVNALAEHAPLSTPAGGADHGGPTPPQPNDGRPHA